MDQDYKLAATKLERIQKTNVKEIRNDLKADLTALISDLKIGVKRKGQVEKKFEALEPVLKTKQPRLWKQIEEIRNSLKTGSMGIVGASNSPLPPEHKTSEMKQLKLENQYLTKILENLFINIFDGEATSQKELKPPEALMSNQAIAELSTKTQKVTHKLFELETEFDYVHKRILRLSSMTIGAEESKVQISSQERTAMGRKVRSYPADTPPKTERILKLDKHLELLESGWRDMKEKESDLERASKIIEDLYNQAVEIKNNQVKLQPENPNTTMSKKESTGKGQSDPKKPNLKKSSELMMTSKAVSPALKNTKGIFQNQTVVNVGQAQGKRKTQTNAISNKNGGKGQEQQVSKKTEPNMASGLEMKGTTVSSVLKEMEDTKGDLKRASKIIEDLYNQAMECNDDQGQGNQETSTTTKTKKESNHKAKTVSVSEPTEPGMASKLETKGRAVSTALKKMEDTKEGINQLKYEIECLEHMLADLNKSISEGGKEPVALCASGEMKDESQAYESARQIFQTLKEKKSQMEKLKDENELLVGLLNALYESVTRKEDLLSKQQSSATPGNGLSGYNMASKIFKKFKEMETLQENTERETKQLKESLRKLQQLNGENTEMKKDIDHLRTRLSEIAGAKLTHDNPSLADLSDPNRPTKLAEKYSEIYDNQWTDAFSTLSKYNADASDEELASYLYNILTDGYRFCARVRMRQKHAIEDILLHPNVNMEFSQGRKTDEVNEIFAKLLCDAAKVSSNVTSVNMVKAFEDNDEMKKRYEKLMVSCKQYIEECVKLCWHMQVQTPPVYMDLKTVKKQAFQKNTYREYTSKGAYIAFVVWPALFLHEGGPLLSKGIAQGK